MINELKGKGAKRLQLNIQSKKSDLFAATIKQHKCKQFFLMVTLEVLKFGIAWFEVVQILMCLVQHMLVALLLVYIYTKFKKPTSTLVFVMHSTQ